MKKIHTGHQRVSKCEGRTVNMVAKIINRLGGTDRQMHRMLKSQSSKARPLIPSTLPELPWQKVSLSGKRDNLLVVDYFSRYIEIAKLV